MPLAPLAPGGVPTAAGGMKEFRSSCTAVLGGSAGSGAAAVDPAGHPGLPEGAAPRETRAAE